MYFRNHDFDINIFEHQSGKQQINWRNGQAVLFYVRNDQLKPRQPRGKPRAQLIDVFRIDIHADDAFDFLR